MNGIFYTNNYGNIRIQTTLPQFTLWNVMEGGVNKIVQV